MKNWLLIVVSMIGMFPLSSQGAESNTRFGIPFMYKGYNLEHRTFSHNTHPEDPFLDDSEVPGSAGTTKIGGLTHYFGFGIQLESSIIENLMYNVDLTCLVGGQRDRHQNDNDPRRPANGAFIYSQSSLGGYAGIGLSYNIWKFYVGGDAQLTGIYISHGWDRWGSDEQASSSIEWYPTIGPKVGFNFFKELAVEAVGQFGKTASLSLGLVWKPF